MSFITFRPRRLERENPTRTAHKRAVSAFAFDEEGRAYTGSHDGAVKCWRAATLEGLSCADECGCWINDLVHLGGGGTDKLRNSFLHAPCFTYFLQSLRAG